jgi:hypothetical protein
MMIVQPAGVASGDSVSMEWFYSFPTLGYMAHANLYSCAACLILFYHSAPIIGRLFFNDPPKGVDMTMTGWTESQESIEARKRRILQGTPPARHEGLKAMNEKRIFDFVIWLIAVCLLAVILTSCSPYQGLQIGTATEAAAPTMATTDQEALLSVATPSAALSTCTLDAGTVYLRKGAGMSYAVIKVLRAGQVLTVIERGTWLKVIARHLTGYVYSKSCK